MARKAVKTHSEKRSPRGNVSVEPPKAPSFWDNPPPMSDAAKEVYDVMSKRIPDPATYGIFTEDIYSIVLYCETQAWLSQRPLCHIPDTQEQMYNHGKVRVTVNPELLAWLRVQRHAVQMHHYLFKRKRKETTPPPPAPDHEEDAVDNQLLTAADFPPSVRESAIEASKLSTGGNLDKIMPFALRIGHKMNRG